MGHLLRIRTLIVTPLTAISRLFRRLSIVGKLAVFVGLLVSLTVGALMIVVSHYTGEMLRSEVDQRLATLVDDRYTLLRNGLAGVEERIRILAGRYRLVQILDPRTGGTTDSEPPPAPSPAEMTRTLDDVRSGTEGVVAFWIEDQRGRRVASSGDRDLIAQFAGRVGAQPPDDDGPTLMGPPSPAGSTYVALFETPVKSRTKGAVGKLFLVVDVGDILGEVANRQRLGETGEIVVGVQDRDMALCLFPPRGTPGLTVIPLKSSVLLRRAFSGSAGSMRAPDRLGHSVLAMYRPVGYHDWVLVAKMDLSEAYAPVVRLERLLLALGGGILALGLAASYLIARKHARPIRNLAAVADRIARGDLDARIEVDSGDEIGALGLAFTRMTDELTRSHAELERRIAGRTRELEATRDLLAAFFRILTSRLDPRNIDRTFDTVLRFCHQLGYDLAMISLVDHDAGVIRGVRGAGTMADVVGLTVRPLDGDDILAVVAREGRTAVIADSTTDPRCDPDAVALARVRGQIVLPMLGDEGPVLGTLQVATPEILVESQVDLRPLKSLASHTARALEGLKQVEEIGRLNRSLEAQAAELGKSEAALREQTRILRSVLDCMSEGVVVADREARLLIVNPAAARILGSSYSLGEMGPWNPRHSVFGPDRSTPLSMEELPLYRAIRGETVDQLEVYVAYPNARNGAWMLVNARPLLDEHEQSRGALVVFHDITRRKNFERRLAVQFAATRVLAEVNSLNEAGPRILEIIGEGLDWDFGAFWRVDHGIHRLQCVSVWHRRDAEFPKFEQATRKARSASASTSGPGLPGQVSSNHEPVWISRITPDPQYPRWELGAEEGLTSGFAAPVLVRGECLGIFEFFCREARASDPALLELAANLGTQIGQFIVRNQMHTRVVQSEKLASLGMLSAGVAHEINNPLAYIANNLAVLERDAESLLALIAAYEKTHAVLQAHCPDLLGAIRELNEECDVDYIKENLDKILGSTRQGVKRVAEIVHNLRGFARLDRAAVDQINVHEPIETALEMIRGRLQRRRIIVEELRGDDVPLIPASLVQLNQVFLNLLVNAMQAIESTHRDDGRIVVRTREHEGYVVVEITDNGCGIPPDVLPQIFNPFFTTKDVGDGTGLGLSITHGIIQDHHGRIEVESTPGQGTCFRVFLPTARR